MHPDLRAIASTQRGVFRTAQAIACGYTWTQIRARVRAGEWVRLRQGVLVARVDLEAAGADPRSEHLVRAAAAVLTLANEPCLSHRTAALAWGLPLVDRVPEDVALTVERQHRRRSPGLELHTAVTPTHHRDRVDGLAVTSVARTLSDLARSRPFDHAVVAADAALQRGLCGLDDVERVISDCPVWPGIARTKRVLAFADRRSESPGESLSRVAMAAAGVLPPDLQVELLLAGGHVRVDFMWPAQRVVGEFDGRLKYGGPEDLWREKLREDRIRRHGYAVVRWVWSDVWPDAAPMVARLRQALA